MADASTGARPDRVAVRAERFPCFDGLRAIAAASVVLYHVAIRTRSTGGAVGQFLARGDIGVTIFFLVSGFLLYRPFTAATQRGEPAPGVGAYCTRRVLRIFPAYWVALLGVTLVLDTADFWGTKSIFTSATLTFVYDRHSFVKIDGLFITPISQAWSLCVELAFYAFLPLYAWAIRRLAARAHRPFTVELGGIGALVVVGVVTDWFAFASPRVPTWEMAVWLPRDLDLFALGMLLAVCSARPAGAPGVLDRAGRYPAACWAGAAALFWVAATRLDLSAVDLFNPARRMLLMERETLYALTAFLLLLPAVFGDPARGAIRAFLRNPWVAGLGAVSYGVFLWHQDVLTLVEERLGFGGAPRFPATLAAVAALSIGIAVVSYRAVERPALRLKDRFAPPRPVRGARHGE